MPTEMTLRDQFRKALELAQGDSGSFGRAVLEEVIKNLHLIPEDIVYQVPTLRELLAARRAAKEVLSVINAADPKTAKIESLETFRRWRRDGYPGLDDG